MRVLIKFIPETHYPWGKINKHTIQGLIYFLLQNTEYEIAHNIPKFKFFTFSDIFPSGDFYPNKEKSLIISSPDPNFISALEHNIKKHEYIYLSKMPCRITAVKRFRIHASKIFKSGSPLVLLKDAKNNEYFSLREHKDTNFLINRVKENALKKYNEYYDDELEMDEEIFDRWSLKKEVALQMDIKGNKFVMIGSVWDRLEKLYIPKHLWKFYNFIMDTGIGEKNSLGFGFINPAGEKNGQ